LGQERPITAVGANVRSCPERTFSAAGRNVWDSLEMVIGGVGRKPETIEGSSRRDMMLGG